MGKKCDVFLTSDSDRGGIRRIKKIGLKHISHIVYDCMLYKTNDKKEKFLFIQQSRIRGMSVVKIKDL